MKDDFLIKIETWHKSDLGTQENVSACVMCFTHLFNVTVLLSVLVREILCGAVYSLCFYISNVSLTTKGRLPPVGFSHQLNLIDPQALVLCEHLCFFKNPPIVCLLLCRWEGEHWVSAFPSGFIFSWAGSVLSLKQLLECCCFPAGA